MHRQGFCNPSWNICVLVNLGNLYTVTSTAWLSSEQTPSSQELLLVSVRSTKKWSANTTHEDVGDDELSLVHHVDGVFVPDVFGLLRPKNAALFVTVWCHRTVSVSRCLDLKEVGERSSHESLVSVHEHYVGPSEGHVAVPTDEGRVLGRLECRGHDRASLKVCVRSACCIDRMERLTYSV